MHAIEAADSAPLVRLREPILKGSQLQNVGSSVQFQDF